MSKEEKPTAGAANGNGDGDLQPAAAGSPTEATVARKPDFSGYGHFNRRVAEILSSKIADTGILVNGDRDYDFRVLRKRMFRRLARAAIGMDRRVFGESFMAGDWDVTDLPEFAYRIVQCKNYYLYTRSLGALSHLIPMRLFNRQSRAEARRDIARHYDLGLELFGHFLDKNMNYSCGYWRNAQTLDEAQLNKMNLIGRKLKLEKGECDEESASSIL